MTIVSRVGGGRLIPNPLGGITRSLMNDTMNDVLHRIQIDLDFLAYWTLANAFGVAIGEIAVLLFGSLIYLSGSISLGLPAVKTIGETLAQAAAVAPLAFAWV